MFFDRGSAADYDSWEKLGNPGWGWKDLLPYFKKVGLRKTGTMDGWVEVTLINCVG
jgi:choline dehydrogenase-like flavoprotein